MLCVTKMNSEADEKASKRGGKRDWKELEMDKSRERSNAFLLAAVSERQVPITRTTNNHILTIHGVTSNSIIVVIDNYIVNNYLQENPIPKKQKT